MSDSRTQHIKSDSPACKGFLIRALGFCIDLILLATILVTISFAVIRPLIAKLDLPPLTQTIQPSPAQAAVYLVLVLIVCAYFLSEVFCSATPGKILIGLYVAKKSGEAASRPQLLLRVAIKLSPHILSALQITAPALFVRPAVSLILMLLWLSVGLGFFMVLMPSRQTLHDALSGTAVFSRPNVRWR